MVEAESWTGYVVPMVQDKPRLKKPPLIYWLQAPLVAGLTSPAERAGQESTGLLKAGIWAYRLPSVLGALVAGLITWRLGRRMFPGLCGWLAGLLVCTCVVVMVDARQARADEVLLATTTLSYWALWNVWRARHGTVPLGWVVVLWLAVALGVMTKGPITPALIVLSVLALSLMTRDWRWLAVLRIKLGVLIVAALVVPWVFLVGQAVGWSKFLIVIADEVLLRSVTPKEGHFGPPGTYLLLLPVLLWPGSMALVPGLMHAWTRGVRFVRDAANVAGHGWLSRVRALYSARRPGRDAELFCLCWLVPGWLVFEALATKLPHYPMPLFPPLALLCARGLYAMRSGWEPLLRTWSGRAALWGWIVLSEVLAVGLPITLAILGQIPRETPVLVAVTALVVAAQAALIAAVYVIIRRRFIAAQLLVLTAAAMSFGAVFQVILPQSQVLWLSSRVVAEIQRIDPQASRPLAASGYAEDSLVFLTAGRVQRFKLPEEAEAWLAEHPQGLIVLDRKTADQLSIKLTELADYEGFNPGAGRWQQVLLATPAPG